MKTTIAKAMAAVTSVFGIVFFVILKSGIGEISAPKNYRK